MSNHDGKCAWTTNAIRDSVTGKWYQRCKILFCKELKEVSPPGGKADSNV